MATVNIAITATVAQLESFANELGYQDFVSAINTTTGVSETVPNPVNRKAFLQEYFKRITVNELAKVRISAIEKAVVDERLVEKQAVRDSIDGAVAVTFKA